MYYFLKHVTFDFFPRLKLKMSENVEEHSEFV